MDEDVAVVLTWAAEEVVELSEAEVVELPVGAMLDVVELVVRGVVVAVFFTVAKYTPAPATMIMITMITAMRVLATARMFFHEEFNFNKCTCAPRAPLFKSLRVFSIIATSENSLNDNDS